MLPGVPSAAGKLDPHAMRLAPFAATRSARNSAVVDAPVADAASARWGQITAIAEEYAVSVPQLCIRYALQLGTQPLPKTANPEHMRSNADVDFEISEADMAALRTLDERDYGEHAAFPVYSGR